MITMKSTRSWVTTRQSLRRPVAIALALVLALTSVVASPSPATAQDAGEVVVSIGDYTVTPGSDFDVVINVDPASAEVAAVQLELSYDPAVITPVLFTDPQDGLVGAVVCIPAAELSASCGPRNPTDTFVVAVFSLTENFAGPTDYVTIQFVASADAGTSPLAISGLIAGTTTSVPAIGVDGSVSVEATAPVAMCNNKEVTIDMRDGASGLGTEGDDVIMGTFRSDTIDGLGGNDTICSLGGDDIISGGTGEDWIHAGAGDDTVEGNYGDDRINGSRGNDDLRGNGGDDTVIGEAGQDTVRGNNGDDVLIGGADDDELNGGAGVDQVAGNAGNDLVRGGPGDDLLNGNSGDDRLVDRDGTNTFIGGGGTDECVYRSGSADSLTAQGCEL